MHMNDFLGNAQPKPKMGFILMGLVTSVEAVKDRFFFCVWNTDAVIFYLEQQFIIACLQGKGNLSFLRGIADGIVQ